MLNEQLLLVLDYCNEVRSILGKEPVEELSCGVKADPYNDVLARTIGDVHTDGMSTLLLPNNETGYTSLVLPVHVMMFIIAFDAGEYEEYEDGH